MSKIKKALECVCFYCSKLLIDMSDDRFARTQLIRDRKRRFQAVWDLCKAKTVCEGGEENCNEQGQEEFGKKKSSHGGCGQKQPRYKKTPLKLVAEFKASRDEASRRIDFNS